MLVKEIKTHPGDVLGIPGDIHLDKQDDEALRIFWDICQAARVNTGVLIGDTHDSIGVSRYPRLARDYRWGKGTVKSEITAGRPHFERLEAIVTANRGNGEGLHALTGNHERWFDLMADEFPGLLDSPWHEYYGDLYDRWHVWANGTALRFGPLLVAHGHWLRGSLAANSAATVLRNYPGQNSLYGHTHRVESCITPTFKYGAPVAHGAWTIGHMRDIKAELASEALGVHAQRHQQGGAIVHFFAVGRDLRFDVTQIVIQRTTKNRPYAVYGGCVFT